MRRNKISLSLGAFCLAGAITALIFFGVKQPASGWDADFRVAKIRSSQDGFLQKIYYYSARAAVAQPLIVSLHSWAGDYKQPDINLSLLAKQKNWNYIHPDFRGANNKPTSCCSDYVIHDIDDAILWAKANLNVDAERVYVVGASGGGYAALCVWMRSQQKIKAFSIWCPITDLVAWHAESIRRKNDYNKEICLCTDSPRDRLDVIKARQRSPLFWQTPVEKTQETKVRIFTGLYDGTGNNPVSPSHALRMYNKILVDLGAQDPAVFVSDQEMKTLAENKPIMPLEKEQLGGRKIYLHKKFQNVELIVFDGGHELLVDQALDGL